MTKEEIIKTIQLYLDQHREGKSKIRGLMAQEPYKGDFFKLFAEAYNNGYIHDSSRPLTPDALTETIASRWFTGEEKADDERTELLSTFSSFWEEWRYAWDHYSKFHQA